MEQNALALSHSYIERCVTEGDVVVDATAGNGNDTLFLAKLVARFRSFVFSLSCGWTAVCKSNVCKILEICEGVTPKVRTSFPEIAKSFKVKGAFSSFILSKSNKRIY